MSQCHYLKQSSHMTLNTQCHYLKQSAHDTQHTMPLPKAALSHVTQHNTMLLPKKQSQVRYKVDLRKQQPQISCLTIYLLIIHAKCIMDINTINLNHGYYLVECVRYSCDQKCCKCSLQYYFIQSKSKLLVLFSYACCTKYMKAVLNTNLVLLYYSKSFLLILGS